MSNVPELLGWGSSGMLLATLLRQVYTQWRTRATAAVSKWPFIGPCTASVGYTVVQLPATQLGLCQLQHCDSSHRNRGSNRRRAMAEATQQPLPQPQSTDRHASTSPRTKKYDARIFVSKFDFVPVIRHLVHGELAKYIDPPRGT
jgi:hypothetical protein